jgi:membrane protease YdiL (CAAX protease family)
MAIGIVEVLARLPSISHPAYGLLFLGIVRLVEAAVILLAVWQCQQGMSSIGLTPETIGSGLRQGLVWSAGFGAVALLGFVSCFLFSIDPFALMRMPLPEGWVALAAFYLVGGVIGPVAEELFFRGVVFGFVRRWGFWPAMIISTGIFVLAHLSGTRIPVTQLVGGVVFSVAYEKTNSLVAPMIIHILGNLSIFTLAAVSLS